VYTVTSVIFVKLFAVTAVRIFKGIEHALAVAAHHLDGRIVPGGQRFGSDFLLRLLRHIARRRGAQIIERATQEIFSLGVGVDNFAAHHHFEQSTEGQARDGINRHFRKFRLHRLLHLCFFSVLRVKRHGRQRAPHQEQRDHSIHHEHSFKNSFRCNAT
jgi:hypothetical protein